jgi:hypothetical protein
VFWKILGIVAAIWIAIMIVGWVIKMLIPVVAISVVVFGGYLLYKAVKGPKATDVGRF